jgi:hypothetical protein
MISVLLVAGAVYPSGGLTKGSRCRALLSKVASLHLAISVILLGSEIGLFF